MGKNFDEEEAAGMAAKMGANATEADIQNVANKMDSMNKGPLAKVWDKVVKLWGAFKSPNTPVALKGLIIGGLIYMVSPVDLVPDIIPVVGLLDDASVIGIVFSQFVRLAGRAVVGATIGGAIGAAISITIKVINKKNVKKALNDRFVNNEEFQNAFKAKVKEKAENAISLDVLDSWGEEVISDVEIKGEGIADDIQVGTEILLAS